MGALDAAMEAGMGRATYSRRSSSDGGERSGSGTSLQARRSGSGSKAVSLLRSRQRWFALLIFLACLAYAALVSKWPRRPHAVTLPGLPSDSSSSGDAGVPAWRAGLFGSSGGAGRREVLVLYVFANNDPEFLNNLRYFVQEAVEQDGGLCDYVIAVKRGHGLEMSQLPPLPPHARYVPHDLSCYDWGVFGWLLLESGHADARRYRYFVFVNSSVRGPFLPPYARGRLHWAQPLLSRITDAVKLVGPTISCEGSPLDGDQNGVWRRNPHVQSYVVATDTVGLRLLVDDGRVFKCYRDRWSTIYYSELGSSAAILDAGYNLDSLMVRYQGVDWRDTAHWDCNGRMTATGEHAMDGVSVDPLEVMFVKVKSYMLTSGWSFSKKAVKYQEWQAQQRARERERAAAAAGAGKSPVNSTTAAAVVSNEFVKHNARFKAPRVLEMRARGAKCFDFGYYSTHNPDLGVLGGDKEKLWKHFVYNGQFEARAHRFTCESLDYAQLTSW